MKVIFRADASLNIGTGHVIRCAALGKTLKEIGINCSFFSLPLEGNLNNWLENEEFKVYEEIPTDQYDVCVIDHYQIEFQEEESYRRFARKIVVIDDWGFRKHDADLIIDPSLSDRTEERKQVNPGVPFVTGSDWLLVREEFKKKKALVQPKDHFRNILVFFGGTDPFNLVPTYLDFIKENPHDFQNLMFNFLISKGHRSAREITSKHLPKNVVLHWSPTSVADLMLETDFYLGSGGSVTWERMCLGITGLVISVVDNQEDVSLRLGREGFHFYLGKAKDFNPQFVFNSLTNILSRQEEIKFRSARCYALIDGCGIDRVAGLITGLY